MSASTGDAVTATGMIAMKQRGERIAIATAHDFLTGRLAEVGGIDAVVVGDSIEVSVLGGEAIAHATIDDMLVFARAVARGAKRPLVIADLPFGSYQPSDEIAVRDATRFIKEGHADAVKLEGGGTSIARAKAIADAGIPVMAHLVPADASWVTDAWRRSPVELGEQALADAIALEAAGCFAVMLESLPAPVAGSITEALSVPSIGFACGPNCDGQVLDILDVLGWAEPSPYVKSWARLGEAATAAAKAFVDEVRHGTFPAADQAVSMAGDDERAFIDSTQDRTR